MTGLAAGVEPLRDGRFRRLLLAMAISALGSSGTLVALSWLVAVELSAGDRLGLVLAAYTVPQFVAGLVGGALADRYGARRLSRVGHVAAGVTLLAMWALGRAGALDVGAVAGLAAVAGTGIAMAQPVTGALMVSIVDETRLGPANMLRVVAVDTAVVLGPLAAGVVIAGGAHTWFLVDAITFLVAAFLLPPPRRPPESGAPQRLAAAGVRFVVGRRHLWTTMAAAGLGNLLVTVPLLVGVPTMAGMSSGALGVFYASFTAGSLLGAAEAGLVRRRRPMLVFLALAGVGVALIALAPAGLMRYGLAAATGFCVAGFDVRWATYLQGSVPGALMGRVLACDAWTSFACRTIGFGTVGLVAVHSPAAVLVVCGLTMAVLAVALGGRHA